MQLSHPAHQLSTRFDEENLLPDAGLVPVMALAQRAGLDAAVSQRLTVAGGAGANAVAKVTSLVAGMAAGADSIDDMAVLGHGAAATVLADTRAPSTLGTFLRAVTFGHVRQLDAIAATTLTGLTKLTPLVPDIERVSYLDIDAPPRFAREVPPPSTAPTATPRKAPRTATPGSRG